MQFAEPPTTGAALSFAADPCDGLELKPQELSTLLMEVDKKPDVTVLSLQGNALCPASANLLANYLRTNRCLQTLNVAMCSLGDGGALELIRAICVQRGVFHSRLRRLDLSCNGITSYGAAVMADTLKNHGGPLRHLILRYNPITPAGASAFMRLNVNLSTLDCSYCALKVDDAGLHRLCLGLRENTSLTLLLLEGNGITKGQLHVMVDALRSNGRATLDFANLVACKAAGHKPNLEKMLASAKAAKGKFTPEIRKEIEEIDGEMTIVRTRPQAPNDGSTTAHASQSVARGRTSMSIKPAEVENAPLPPTRSASQPRTYRAPSILAPVENSHVCGAPPAIGRNKEPQPADATPQPAPVEPPANEKEEEASKEVDNRGEYCAPRQPQLLCRSASVGSRSSSVSSRASRQSSGKSVLSLPPQRLSGSVTGKGSFARALLDRCAASDSQCAEILGIGGDLNNVMGKGKKFDDDQPKLLVDVTGVPSQLDALPLRSRERVMGLAKVLYCILHAATGRMGSDAIKKFASIPESYQLATSEAIAKFQSVRLVEDNDARRYLMSTLSSCNPLTDGSVASLHADPGAHPSRRPSRAALPRYMQIPERYRHTKKDTSPVRSRSAR